MHFGQNNRSNVGLFFFTRSKSSFAFIFIFWLLTPNEHINTAEQRTIIKQYDDWYTGR